LVAGGTQLRPFSQDILRICEKTTFELYDEIAASNPRFKTVYEPWKKFREDELLWFSIAEISLDYFMISSDQQRRRQQR
jgi:TRAP-type mannitol/chloroaromatic compound transport system substrate-binding protein